MLEIAIGFVRGALTLRWPWWIWIALLVVANAVAPLFFLGTVEARAVLAAILVAAAIMMAIFRARGFVRLLGLGHLVVWPFLLVWLASRLPGIEPGPFRSWVQAVILLDTLSLLIDLADVIRYAAGDRTAIYTLADTSSDSGG